MLKWTSNKLDKVFPVRVCKRTRHKFTGGMRMGTHKHHGGGEVYGYLYDIWCSHCFRSLDDTGAKGMKDYSDQERAKAAKSLARSCESVLSKRHDSERGSRHDQSNMEQTVSAGVRTGTRTDLLLESFTSGTYSNSSECSYGDTGSVGGSSCD